MQQAVNRGDIFYANLKSDGTCRQNGIRPIVIVSNQLCNRYSPVVSVVALTTSQKKHSLPTHIALRAEETGLERDSICLCEQPMTISKADLLNFVTCLSEKHMGRVDQGLRCQLCL